MEHQQPLRDVHPTIGVDPDQMVIEGGVERDAIGDDRLGEELMGIGPVMWAASRRRSSGRLLIAQR